MDTNTHQKLTNNQEISLADEAGILKFLEHIGQFHSVVVELATPYGEDVDVLEWVQYAENMYRQLKHELYKALQELAAGQTVDEVTVQKIQEFYDELVLARDTIASIELEDAVHEVLNEKIDPNANHTPSPYQKELLTDNILNHPEYKTVIETQFRSIKAFEAHLRRLIDKIEEPSMLDKALRLEQASVFYGLLKDMTMEEIDELLSLPRNQLRELLTSRHMNYRLFVEWIDVLNVLRQVISHNEDNTFAELLMAAELEELIE